MKKLKKFKQLVLLISISFACISCEKKEDYYAKTYYDVVGEGYVFMYDSMGNILYPIEGAEVKIITKIEGTQVSFVRHDPKEFFYSDATGKYQVRFIKRAEGYDAERYSIIVDKIGWFGLITLSAADVTNAQYIILLDTFKVYKY